MLASSSCARRDKKAPPKTEDDSAASESGTSQDPDINSSAAPTDTSSDATQKERAPVVLRRLNRTEYDATIRDLFGEDLQLAKDFPSEDLSLGFDNISASQSLSPLQLEMYERAAWRIAERYVLATPTPSTRQHFEAETMSATTGAACCGGFWNLYANGEVEQSFTTDLGGQYSIKVRAYGQQMGAESTKMAVKVDGVVIDTIDVAATENSPGIFELEHTMATGSHQISLAFVNDAHDPGAGTDRNLLLDWVRVEGPIDASPTPNPRLAAFLACDEKTLGLKSCYTQWIEAFAPRAWRRPLNAEEKARFDGVWEQTEQSHGRWDEAVAKALAMLLVSPHFLFRVEIDPNPNTPTSRNLNGYELAVRLSYFLWSSMPDQELFALAHNDQLLDESKLMQQIDRMLQDPKSNALVENFAGQWLSIRAIDDVFKDVVTYPRYTPTLIESLKGERSRFFQSMLSERRPIQDLLLAQDTFVNRELAQFYGLSEQGLSENSYERRSLVSTRRRGIFGQAGLMSVLGHPENTAPVLRGKWVLENLLCIHPPPPPGDLEIPPIEPSDSQTMREQLAVHRANPNCAACHNLMDPLGLALENFDGIGSWRDQQHGRTLDVSGSLPTGETFQGPIEMANAIAKKPEFFECVTRKALTYALGRDLSSLDDKDLASIIEQTKAQGGDFGALFRSIARSPVFRQRG